MTARTTLIALLMLVGASISPARAGDEGPATPDPAAIDQPPANACRVALIPAHKAWIERQVTIPAVTEEMQVPVTETVQVPVYGTLTWKETVQVEVPRYERKNKPVKVKLWNPFRCWKEFDVELFRRKKCEQVGTQTETQVVERSRQVVVGTREEVRVVGTRTEVRVKTPARVETVRECVELPDEWVTLGPDGTKPLPGTAMVLTEARYKAILTAALKPAP